MTRSAMLRRAAIALLSTILFGGFVVGFVQHSINDSDQKWCELFAILASPPPLPPKAQATTPAGEKLVQYNKDKATYERNVALALKNLSRKSKCNK